MYLCSLPELGTSNTPINHDSENNFEAFFVGDADGYIWSKSFLFFSKRKQESSGHQDHRNFFIQTDVIVSNLDGSYHSESKATISCPISALTRDSILGNILPCHFVLHADFYWYVSRKNIPPCRTDLIM